MADVAFAARYLTGSLSATNGNKSQSLRYDLRQFKPFTANVARPGVLEFLELMLALYAVDRISPREQSWNRIIKVRFPVLKERLGKWRDVQRDVEDLCARATGDEVSIELVERQAAVHFDYASVPFALRDDLQPVVSLFSCGLDSLCGVARIMTETAGTHLLVSIVSNPNKTARFDAIKGDLDRYFGEGRVETLRLGSFLDRSNHKSRRQEKTQRFRTPLAIAAGLTAAAMVGSKVLNIHENGIGLMNLPVPSVQLTHESSQALFPADAKRWSLVSDALLDGVVIDYPNRFRTKGEMLKELPAALEATIRRTTSCDAPPRISGLADCGLCGSCIFRRLALYAANLSEHDTRYSWTEPSDNIDREAALKHHARLLQQWLLAAEPWKELCLHQPTLLKLHDETTESEKRHAIMQATIDLLSRHCDQALSWKVDHAA